MGAGFDGVGLEIMPRLSPAAPSRTTANALSSNSRSRRCGSAIWTAERPRPKRRSLVSLKLGSTRHRFEYSAMICGAVALALLAARHQGSFMALACVHTTAPTGHCASVTVALRSLRALADPLGRWTGRPVGRADLGVAFQPDDVAEAQLVKEADQFGVGKAGQDGNCDVVGKHLGQPPQANVLVIVARGAQLVLQHAKPDQRRCPTVTGHQLERHARRRHNRSSPSPPRCWCAARP